jgi:hypothetical protein
VGGAAAPSHRSGAIRGSGRIPSVQEVGEGGDAGLSDVIRWRGRLGPEEYRWASVRLDELLGLLCFSFFFFDVFPRTQRER